jgi:hypothetical protein
VGARGRGGPRNIKPCKPYTLDPLTTMSERPSDAADQVGGRGRTGRSHGDRCGMGSRPVTARATTCPAHRPGGARCRLWVRVRTRTGRGRTRWGYVGVQAPEHRHPTPDMSHVSYDATCRVGAGAVMGAAGRGVRKATARRAVGVGVNKPHAMRPRAPCAGPPQAPRPPALRTSPLPAPAAPPQAPGRAAAVLGRRLHLRCDFFIAVALWPFNPQPLRSSNHLFRWPASPSQPVSSSCLHCY